MTELRINANNRISDETAQLIKVHFQTACENLQRQNENYYKNAGRSLVKISMAAIEKQIGFDLNYTLVPKRNKDFLPVLQLSFLYDGSNLDVATETLLQLLKNMFPSDVVVYKAEPFVRAHVRIIHTVNARLDQQDYSFGLNQAI